MKASILTIGDEILIGQITDTNSVSIARRLNAAGIAVLEKCSIGDERTQIVSAVERLLAASEIVVLTGGLGPTVVRKDIHTFGRSRYRRCEGDHVVIRILRVDAFHGRVCLANLDRISDLEHGALLDMRSSGCAARQNTCALTYGAFHVVEVELDRRTFGNLSPLGIGSLQFEVPRQYGKFTAPEYGETAFYFCFFKYDCHDFTF